MTVLALTAQARVNGHISSSFSEPPIIYADNLTDSLKLEGYCNFFPVLNPALEPNDPLRFGQDGILSYGKLLPRAGSPSWVVFNIHSHELNRVYFISFDGPIENLDELIIQNFDGEVQRWSKDTLSELGLRNYIANHNIFRINASAYDFRVFLKMEEGYSSSMNLRLWDYSFLIKRINKINMVFILVIEFYFIIIFLSLIAWLITHSRAIAFTIPFSVLSFLLIIFLFKPGGLPGIATEGSVTGIVLNFLLILILGYSLCATFMHYPWKKKPKKWQKLFFALALLLLSFIAFLKTVHGTSIILGVLLLSALIIVKTGFDKIRKNNIYANLNMLFALFLAIFAATNLGFLIFGDKGNIPLVIIFSPSFVMLNNLSSLIALAIGAVRMSRENSRELQDTLVKLEKAAVDRRNFISRMASDFRRPLNNISESLSQISGGQISQNLLYLAREECSRLLNLVDLIHYYAQTDTAIPEHLSEPFNLSSLTDIVISSARLLKSARSVNLVNMVPVTEINNDPRAMQSLLFTIVQRTLVFCECEEIIISSRADNFLVWIDIKSRCRFHSDDSQASSMELNMIQYMTRSLGGSLEHSTGDSGCQYSMVFPRSMSWQQNERRNRIPPLQDEDDLEHRDTGHFNTVLVVDDEPVSLFLLKQKLESKGWNVIARISAVQAIEELKLYKFADLVIVNSTMVEMSGSAFSREVRKLYSKENLPVIMLMDTYWPVDIDMAFSSGASDFLNRPVIGTELFARVKIHMDLLQGLKRELEHKDKMAEVDKFKILGWLTAGVAHEINTPNNAALRNLPLLKEIWQELSPFMEKINEENRNLNLRGFKLSELSKEINEMLNDLYMGAQSIKKIVEDLKDYSRSREENKNSRTDINAAISYAMRLLKHSIAITTDNFVFVPEKNLPPARIDMQKLTQVIVNIIENSLQAIESRNAGIMVKSSVEENPDKSFYGIIKIQDEGAGMDEETLASVFEPFFTRRQDKKGTGLGLAVASGIIKEANGEINITSMPGAGTSVIIKLPLSAS